MASSRFFNLLRDKISKVIEGYGTSIICGEVKDFAEYRDACGYIRGLNDALRLCEDIERDLDS